ncbi:MAG: SHOCT domain-containing protein [Ruminiclostridium sp.]|nr:SHOCT domain-containing protein [Ruminiclostridium sp.]
MGTLTITREKKLLGAAAALYCFVSDRFLDENKISVCNYLENGKTVTLTFDSDVVGMKCRVGAFRQVDAPVVGQIYAIDFRENPIVNAFVTLKGKVDFTDETGNSIEVKTLLEYAQEHPLVKPVDNDKELEVEEWVKHIKELPFGAKKRDLDIVALYKTFVPTESFAPSKQYHMKLAIDEARKKWAYFDEGITLINQAPHRSYSYSDIVSFEILENGSSITKGGLGAAAVGGALFGGAGAVVGATTGTKRTAQICNSMQVAVTVKDDENPNIYIPIVKSAVPSLSKEYTKSLKMAKDIVAVLERLYVAGQEIKSESKSSESIDDLRKYKGLLDDGLITAEEYAEVKKRILKL